VENGAEEKMRVERERGRDKETVWRMEWRKDASRGRSRRRCE
jgi:hypothetical protein